MSTEDKLFRSLLDGLTKDDKISVLRSIEDTRELQLEQKRHPRRRRRRNEDGVLEPVVDLTPGDDYSDLDSADEVDESEIWEMSD